MAESSILAWLTSAPLDLWLELEELRLSIEWDSYARTVAIPLGSGLVAASSIAKRIADYYTTLNRNSKNVLFDTDQHTYEMIKASMSNHMLTSPTTQLSRNQATATIWAFGSFRTLLFALCTLLTYNIATSSRKYTFMYRDSAPKSPLAVKYVSWKHLWMPWARNLFTDLPDPHDYWQLLLWTPDLFSLHMWMVFNPVNLFVTSLSIPAIDIFILVAGILLSLYSITGLFLALVRDKQVIYQETSAEYDLKFVRPKLNVLKKDVVVDATEGPYESTVSMDKQPYSFLRSRVFTTHDMKGKPVVQYGFELAEQTSSPPTPVLIGNTAPMNNWNQVRHDNDLLRIQNQRLEKKLMQFSKFYDADDINDYDDDLDQDQSWFTSATPFVPSRGLPVFPDTSTPHLRVPALSRSRSTSPFKHNRFEHNRLHPMNRSPSPVKTNRTPLGRPLDRGYQGHDLRASDPVEVFGLHTSAPPLPTRSPNRSPTRSPMQSRSRLPFKSPSREMW